MTIQPGRRYPTWTIGDRIRKARLMMHMSQTEFASAINVADGSLAAWETDRTQPRALVSIAKRIEVLTGIPAAWLVGLEDGPPDLPGGDGHPLDKPTDSWWPLPHALPWGFGAVAC